MSSEGKLNIDFKNKMHSGDIIVSSGLTSAQTVPPLKPDGSADSGHEVLIDKTYDKYTIEIQNSEQTKDLSIYIHSKAYTGKYKITVELLDLENEEITLTEEPCQNVTVGDDPPPEA